LDREVVRRWFKKRRRLEQLTLPAGGEFFSSLEELRANWAVDRTLEAASR